MAADLKNDLLVAIYTRNDQYHDAKDNVIWILSTVYVGFAVAVLGWMFANPCVWREHQGGFIVLLCIVFVPACVLIWWQNWLKCISLKKTDLFHQLVEELREKERDITYGDLERIDNLSKIEGKKIRICKVVPLWEAFRIYKKGPGPFMLYSLLTLLIVQIVVVCCF